MTQDTRTLRIGAIAIALLAAVLVSGFLLVRHGNGTIKTTPTTIASSQPALDPKAAVEQAYLRHWVVFIAAFHNLNPTELESVLSGSALDIVRRQVQEQKRMNEPVEVRVEHNYSIVMLNGTTASVDDNYINHSIRLDGGTGKPIEKDPNQKVHKTYTLKKVSEQWKITDIISYR